MVLPGYHSTYVPTVKEEVLQEKEDEQITSARSSYHDIPLLFPQEDKETGVESHSYEASSMGRISSYLK